MSTCHITRVTPDRDNTCSVTHSLSPLNRQQLKKANKLRNFNINPWFKLFFFLSTFLLFLQLISLSIEVCAINLNEHRKIQ